MCEWSETLRQISTPCLQAWHAQLCLEQLLTQKKLLVTLPIQTSTILISGGLAAQATVGGNSLFLWLARAQAGLCVLARQDTGEK